MNLGLADVDFRLEMLVDPLLALATKRREGHRQSYTKGDIVLRQGANTNDIFIVQSGLVKLFYTTSAGNEWVKSFIAGPGIFASVEAQDPQQPSRFGAQCIEPCEIVRLPLGWARQAIAEDSNLTHAYLAYSAWVQRRKEVREEMLLCQSPEQAYRQFLAQSPDLAGRLQQGDIARYLGITPIAFSRIKRRMRG